MTQKAKLFLIKLIPSKFIRDIFRRRIEPNIFNYERSQQLYNIGKRSYIAPNSFVSNSKTVIGNFCSIADNVFIGPSQHPTHFLSTHPFVYSGHGGGLYGDLHVPRENIVSYENSSIPVEIGNDVWIGAGAIIMDGIKVGDGAVIGGGAIVTKDVPPYAVVFGVPAKISRYRFAQNIIDDLLELKWWHYPEDFIVTLPFSNVKECIRILKENIDLREKM